MCFHFFFRRPALISAGRPKKRGKTFTPLMFFEEITMTLQLKKGDLKF